jgi:predicted nucleic acid-binding protein
MMPEEDASQPRAAREGTPVCLPDTSCLIHLDRIDRLDLLSLLYDDIRVPPAVEDEFGGAPGTVQTTSRPPNRPLVTLLRRTVDRGEAEVIALATDRQDAHVILDDAAARTEVKDLGRQKILV